MHARLAAALHSCRKRTQGALTLCRVFAKARSAWVLFDEPVGPERLRAHKIWVRDLALNAVALHPEGAAHRAYPLGVFGLPVAPKRVKSKSLLRKSWGAL